MATYQTAETQKIASTSTATYATFDGGIKKCYISADGDCFISFDGQVPVVSGHALFIKANTGPVEINFSSGSVQKIWGISSGSVNIYILGVR